MQDSDTKHVLITGANTGIGLATSTEMARRGSSVLMACRSEQKGALAVEQVVAATGNQNVSYLKLDLSDLSSVRSAAAEVISSGRPLDVLINNAGVAGQRGQTADGFELAFGTNHLGHFLFTLLLMPVLTDGGARVVNVASCSHFDAKRIVWERLAEPTATYVGMREYEVSKLCNVLFTQQLADRYREQGIVTFSVDPGTVGSDVWRRIPSFLMKMYEAVRPMKTTEQGAAPSLFCATATDLDHLSGSYFNEDCEPEEPSQLVTKDLGQELWSRSLVMVDLKDPIESLRAADHR